MASKRDTERRRAGSGRRDEVHQSGGDWSCITVPDGVGIWKPTAGVQKVDILLFKVQNNPHAHTGDWYYETTYFRHAGIGSSNGKYVCANRTFQERCPICNYLAEQTRLGTGDKELLKKLKPSERQLWLLIDLKEPEKGPQLWEQPWWWFGKMLDELRKLAEEDERYIKDFDDPSAGATLRIVFTTEKFDGNSFVKPLSIEFKERKGGYDDSLLDHGVCLDPLPQRIEYNKLMKIFQQTGEPEADAAAAENPEIDVVVEAEQTTTRQPMLASAVGISRLTEVYYKLLHCTVVKISEDETSLTLIDDEGGVIKAIAVDEVVVFNKELVQTEVDEDDIPFDEVDTSEKTSTPKETSPDNDSGNDPWNDDWPE